MGKNLPMARKRKRVLFLLALLAALILTSVFTTTKYLFNRVMEDKKISVINHLAIMKNMVESKTHANRADFADSLFRAYQESINKLPLGVMEHGLVGELDGRMVVLLAGRGDPRAKRHPKYFYLVDEKGEPLYLPSDHVLGQVMEKALKGQSGLSELTGLPRGDFLVGYTPLSLNGMRLGLAVGLPLAPLQSAMKQETLFILALAFLLIAVGLWVFLHLNPMLAELSHSQEVSIQMLGEASHFKDTDTGWHVERMSDYAAAIARAMKLPPKETMMLKLAARMHDLGKVGTPDKVLKKPGQLEDKEWVIMREHSSVGEQIMANGDSPLFVMAREIARGHHEKWDGSGYPDRKAGNDIPLVARITAVADVFDALTMKRPYKEAWPVEKALAVIKEDAGTHFDPEVVVAFLGIEEEILAIKAYWEEREQTHAAGASTLAPPPESSRGEGFKASP